MSLRFIIGLITFLLCLYLGYLFDKAIVDWILAKVPNNEWYEIIEVVIWVGVLIPTAGIIFTVSILVGKIVSLFIPD